MIPVFRHAFRGYRGAILGWGLGLGLLALFLVPFYDTVVDQQEQLLALVASYPEEFMAFFGDVSNFATPEGYLSVEFFSYLPLILGIFAVLAGSGLLVADEERGVLDLLMAHPVSRGALFAGRLLAFLAAMVAILAVIWLAMVAGLGSSEHMDLTPPELARPLVAVFAQLLLFGSLALSLSLVLPSRRSAALLSGVLLVGSFFVTGLARLSEDIERVSRYSPLTYYQSGDAIRGLNGEWLAGLLAVAGMFLLLAWWRFRQRDIRVGGEAGWGLRRLRLRRRAVEPP